MHHTIKAIKDSLDKAAGEIGKINKSIKIILITTPIPAKILSLVFLDSFKTIKET